MAIAIGSALDLSVRHARIKWKEGKETKAQTMVLADITPMLPAQDDLIGVVLDGIELFARPFSEFKLAGADDEHDSGLDDEGDGHNNPYL